MLDPVLFVVDTNIEDLENLERLLRKRYGADFRVMLEQTPDAALATLERLAHQGEEVALVAAYLTFRGQTVLNSSRGRVRCTRMPGGRCSLPWTGVELGFPSRY